MSFDNFIAYAAVAMGEFQRAVSRPLKNPAAIGYALTCLMRAEKDGFACAMLLDGRQKYITAVCLKRHGEMAEQSVTELIAEAAEKYRASYFVVAHNHKAGILLPSNADLMTTELIRQRFLNEKVKFLEHYIIAGDAWSTLLDHRTGKKYITLKDLLK